MKPTKAWAIVDEKGRIVISCRALCIYNCEWKAVFEKRCIEYESGKKYKSKKYKIIQVTIH